MATQETPVVTLFRQKAALLSAKIVDVEDVHAAISYAIDICEKKDFCEQYPISDGQASSEGETPSRGQDARKMIAAPGLDAALFAGLDRQGQKKGFLVIREGMRDYLSGIDVGFSTAEMGIAETGTCVMATESEDLRLATMVCEVHVVALRKSAIVHSLYDAEEYLNGLMSQGPLYTSFISGPSRTADIERVLTLGVHGPLELHVALMEE